MASHFVNEFLKNVTTRSDLHPVEPGYVRPRRSSWTSHDRPGEPGWEDGLTMFDLCHPVDLLVFSRPCSTV